MLLREGLTRILTDAGLDVVAAYDNADALLNGSAGAAGHRHRGHPAAAHAYRRGHARRAADPPATIRTSPSWSSPSTSSSGLAMQLLSESAEKVGYLLKDRIGDVGDFVDAVRRVAAGGSAIDPQIVSTLLQRRRSDDPLARLTPREREVLELMAAGNSNQGIADRLVITLRAVEKYVSSVFDKLGLPSTGTESRRVLAVLLYLRS